MFEVITPERAKYHEFQDKLKHYIKKGSLIYDIGRSDSHNYNDKFTDYDYKTIDRLERKNPDILLDLEKDPINLPKADVIICNGVTEQCDNPFKIRETIGSLLKDDGYVLFGILSIGFEIYGTDYIRFTPNGVERFLRDYKILEKGIVYRNDIPSYVLAIVKR